MASILLVTGMGLGPSGLLPPPPGSSVSPGHTIPPPAQSQPVTTSSDDWGDFFSSR